MRLMTSSSQRFSAFKHCAYRRYFAARFFTSFATQILAVAVAFHMYEVTKNPLDLGWIGLVQFAPALMLVIATGWAADNFSRRGIMGMTVLGEMTCALVILFLTVTGKFAAIPVLAVLIVFGIARAFFSPASASLGVNLVPKEDFANAAGFASIAWQSASIIGPAVGGLLQWWSSAIAYGTSAVMFGVAALLVFAIEKPKQPRVSSGTDLSTLLGGFTFVWKQKVVLGVISLDLFAVLLGGAVAMLPVYAQDILEIGAFGNGLLRAAPGIGAIIMMGAMTAFPIRDYAGIIMFVSVVLFGASTMVFGASRIAWVSILALMGVGAFDMVSVYIREILLQLATPDHVRGRVTAVNSIFIGASNQLGEARAGFMAAIFGPVITVVVGGAAAIGIAGVWAWLFPAIRHTRQLDNPE